MTENRNPAASGEAARSDPEGFFRLIFAVTLAPYLLFPFSAQVAPQNPGLDAAVSVLLFLGAGGHVASSFFFYLDARVREFMGEARSPRYVLLPAALLVASVLYFSSAGAEARSYGLICFWIWQVHHFTRQNHGILAFVSRAFRRPARSSEQIAIKLTGIGAVLATLAFVAPVRHTVLAGFRWHLYATGFACYLCAWIPYLAARPWRDLRDAPWRAWVVLSLMGFYLPLFLFQDAFSAVFIYLTAHGLQYLVFMYFVASVPRARRRRALAALAVLTVAGGAGIKMLQTGSLWGEYAFAILGLQLGVTTWHFLLDAGIWRLSEPFQRTYVGERFAFLRERSG
jgi:hypothetical protein